MSGKPTAGDPVSLRWVDGGAPFATPAGTSFGIPWAQGEVDRTTAIAVTRADGTGVPVQTWPLAYWPDGSLKWTGHALAADSGLSESLTLTTGTPAEPQSPVSVSEEEDKLTVSTGSFQAQFNKSGNTLIESLSLDGQVKARQGVLVVNVQDGPDEGEAVGPRPTVTGFKGDIESVQVEQNGPVRAVIKVTGKYTGSNHDGFLPFTVRFYVAAGATSLRLVHFFVYDGDQNKDFIKGIGLTFQTPLSDELYNRHVRFSTIAGGIWGEPVIVLSGLRRDATPAVLTPQFEGRATPSVDTWPTTVSSGLGDLARWTDFTLDQLSSERFTIGKRSTGKVGWLNHAGFGERASGAGYVGGANVGGVIFGLRDFWQGAPRGLDIRDAHEDEASVTLWAYSPRAPALDMRHYDTVAHGLDLSYEDVGDPDPTPEGIGRSYEITLQLVNSTPSRDSIAKWGNILNQAPQIVATPEFYASHKLFGGYWDLPNTSNSGTSAIEKRKSDLLDFYVAEIEQRQFYGFWDYGDVMHTYDQTRHTWRYDVGGYAWDNGELGTDLWLWMSFLRTGRADVWRIAHAMTRHLSETDFHHTGTFAGLGSRHNVSHWGDGAKEARVGSSSIKRPFYYLTADELMGDILDASLQADQSIITWEPLRKILPPPPDGLGRVRIGPDWVALAGNWFTKWERTNDSKWLEKLKTGMHDIGQLKYGFFSGRSNAVGYDAETGHLSDLGGEGGGSYHLTMLFGGGEFLMELVQVVTDEPEFDAAWLDFCRLYNASDDDKIARYGKSFNSGGFQQLYSKLQAYAGARLNDTSIKQAAWSNLSGNATGVWEPVRNVGGTDVINPIKEIPNLATNDSASLSLAEYAVIAVAPELAPGANAQMTDEWDKSTVAVEDTWSEKNDGVHREVGRGSKWRRLLCMS